MVKFDPPELQAQIKKALQVLNDDCNFDFYRLDADDFNPTEYEDDTVTLNSEVTAGLYNSDDQFEDFTVKDLLRLARMSGKQILRNRTEFLFEGKYVAHLKSVGDHIYRHTSKVATSIKIDGHAIDLKLRAGSPEFALLAEQEGGCGEENPAYSPYYTYVEAEFPQSLNASLLDGAVSSFLFELAASYNICFERSPFPVFSEDNYFEIDWEQPAGTPADSPRMRPLSVGTGMKDLHTYYLDALRTNAVEFQLVGFVKILEYVSATVIRLTTHEILRQRLLTKEALAPSAAFLDNLIRLIEDQRILKRDSEAIKLTTVRCCDSVSLSQHASPNLAKLRAIKEENDDKAKRAALEELSLCLTATRNQFAHAKANYEMTGQECPSEHLEQLVICARTAAEQAIRWYASLPEVSRIS